MKDDHSICRQVRDVSDDWFVDLAIKAAGMAVLNPVLRRVSKSEGNTADGQRDSPVGARKRRTLIRENSA